MSDTPTDVDVRDAVNDTLTFIAERGGRGGQCRFIDRIVRFLHARTGAKYTYCGTIDNQNGNLVKTVAFAVDGEMQDNISYKVVGAPCERVMGDEVLCFPENVQSEFPACAELKEMAAESYAGVPLVSAEGVIYGILAAVDEGPIQNPETVKSILGVLAVSAAAELERVELETSLRTSERRFQDFAESTADWFWEMSADLKFSYLSDQFENETGDPIDSRIGKTRHDIVDGVPIPGSDEAHYDDLANQRPFKDFVYIRNLPDGGTRYVSVSGTPTFDGSGDFTGYRGTAHNVTEHWQQSIELQQREMRYQLATSNAAVVDWDVINNKSFRCPRLREMLGYSADAFDKIFDDTLMSICHPDDVEAHRARRDAHMDYPEMPYESEFRLKTASGDYKWFESRGQAICDDDGKPIRLVGFIIDIDDRKELEYSLVDATERAVTAERQLRAALNALEDGFAIYDANDRLIICNEVYCQMFQEIADDIVPGRRYEDIIRDCVNAGLIVDAEGREEDWLAERMALRAQPVAKIERKLTDGRRLKISEHKTPDGATVSVLVDITAIKEAQETAESASQAKSDFLSSMSHELRTPLNAILGFGQLLRNDMRHPLTEAQRRAVNHILNGGAHLLTLVDEVLDLAKIEAGKKRLSIERMELDDLMDDCISTVESLAATRDIRIIDQSRIAKMFVMADYTRLKQVILNLMTNAIKYNKDNGSVELNIERASDDKARISIKDTGPGIPEERWAELFQPFSRLGAEISDIEGTGIGLTISERLIKLMKGDIGFDSKVGFGSCFWIEIPVSRADDGFDALIPKQLPEHDEPCAPERPSTGRPYTVLYVEDNPTNVRLMEQIIDMVPDGRLVTTHSAEQGLKMVDSEEPDVILMDINLPGMNGVQALHRLKTRPDTSTIPVIAVSADAMPESIQQGLDAGFKAYLTKPIRVDEILDILDANRP